MRVAPDIYAWITEDVKKWIMSIATEATDSLCSSNEEIKSAFNLIPPMFQNLLGNSSIPPIPPMDMVKNLLSNLPSNPPQQVNRNLPSHFDHPPLVNRFRIGPTRFG